MNDIDKKIQDIIALPEADRIAAMKKCAKGVFYKGLVQGMLTMAAISLVVLLIYTNIKKKHQN